MKLTNFSDVPDFTAHALDFTLSHLISCFRDDADPIKNITEYSKHSLDSIIQTESIPLITEFRDEGPGIHAGDESRLTSS
jgi:hypothetical protein